MEIEIKEITIQQLVIPNIRVMNIMETRVDGSFPCPQCASILSPDDFDEISYILFDVLVDEQGNLEAIFLRCRCGQHILIDFNVPTFPSLSTALCYDLGDWR